jgi:hypothetical protein
MKVDKIQHQENLLIDSDREKWDRIESQMFNLFTNKLNDYSFDIIKCGESLPIIEYLLFKEDNTSYRSNFYWHETPEGVIKNESR